MTTTTEAVTKGERAVFALLERHERFHTGQDFKLVRVPDGQSLDFDEGSATRRWLYPHLGDEFHLVQFIVTTDSASSPQAPAGDGAEAQEWQLVPLKVTNAMIDAANDVPSGIAGSPPHWQWVWDAMLAASPAASSNTLARESEGAS